MAEAKQSEPFFLSKVSTIVLGQETVIEPPARAMVNCTGLPTTIKPASTDAIPGHGGNHSPNVRAGKLISVRGVLVRSVRRVVAKVPIVGHRRGVVGNGRHGRKRDRPTGRIGWRDISDGGYGVGPLGHGHSARAQIGIFVAVINRKRKRVGPDVTRRSENKSPRCCSTPRSRWSAWEMIRQVKPLPVAGNIMATALSFVVLVETLPTAGGTLRVGAVIARPVVAEVTTDLRSAVEGERDVYSCQSWPLTCDRPGRVTTRFPDNPFRGRSRRPSPRPAGS